jgi:hypothetical protein
LPVTAAVGRRRHQQIRGPHRFAGLQGRSHRDTRNVGEQQQRAVQRALLDHLSDLQRRERGGEQGIVDAAAVVEIDLAIACLDDLHPYHAIADGLRRDDRPRERIAVLVVVIGDPAPQVHPVAKG